MAAFEQPKAEWNAGQRGKQEPAGATKMNLPPILHNNYAGNRDGDKHGEWSSYLERNKEGQQRDSDECLTKTECGADQRGDEHDEQNANECCVDVDFPDTLLDSGVVEELRGERAERLAEGAAYRVRSPVFGGRTAMAG